jgi:hypothetical protein
MSNHARRRPSRYTRSQLEAVALAASKFDGCCCDLEVKRVSHAGTIRWISVVHDEGCPVLDGAGVSFVLLPNQQHRSD